MNLRLLFNLSALMLVLSGGFLACQKSEDSNPLDHGPDLQVTVVSGVVRDADTGDPISGAVITSNGGRDTTSNDSGYYRLEVQASNAGISDTLTCSVDGYYQQKWPFIAYLDLPRTKDFQLDPLDHGPDLQVTVVSGVVRDADTGDPISGAVITSNGGRDTTSNDSGYYRLEVQASNAGISDTLTCSVDGYYQQKWPFIAYLDLPRTKDFQLDPLPAQNTNATISGHVQSAEDSVAIQRAKVVCAGEEVFTNTNGNYTLSVPAGICTLTVSASGFTSQQQALELAERENRTIDFTLEAAEIERGRVYGTVTTNSRDAIPGAHVVCGADEAYTDQNGDYEINLPVGSKVVIVSAGGFETKGQDVTVAANGDHRLDFQLNPSGVGQWGLVTGRVINASTTAGIAAALITCGNESTVTDGFGTYNLRSPIGSQNVTASANGFTSATQPVTVVNNGSHVVNFALTPTGQGGDTGIVQGQITDNSNNRPINGATVSCAGRSTRSVASGAYSLRVPAGMQTVTASAPSYTSSARQANVPAGGRVTVNIALTPGGSSNIGTVTGRVTDSSNNHAIYLAQVQGGGNSTYTDLSGNYQLTMAAGNQTIQASADGYTSATQNANVVADQTITVNFALNPTAGSGKGQISGTVKNSAGAAISGATVFSDDGTSAATNASGFYQMEVNAGDRTITASAVGYRNATQSLQVITNRRYTLNFTLSN